MGLAGGGVRHFRAAGRRLARAAGLQCVHPGPAARTTLQDSKAIGGLVDLVDRQFTAPEPDQLWVGDITYISTYSGFAYLATLIDMCSNKVVGWAVDYYMRTGRCSKPWIMRLPPAGRE